MVFLLTILGIVALGFYPDLRIFYLLAMSFYVFLFLLLAYNLLRGNPYSQKEIEQT